MGVIFGTQLVLSDRHSVFKNMQDSEVEISLSTEGHFWKPSSVSTVCCCIHKCKLRCKVSNNVEKLDAFFQINTEKMHIDVCITEHGASNLHICAGTIDAEQYKLVMEDQRWPSRCRLFQRKASNHILHILQQHSSVWKEPKCCIDLPAPSICHKVETFGSLWNRKNDNESPKQIWIWFKSSIKISHQVVTGKVLFYYYRNLSFQ